MYRVDHEGKPQYDAANTAAGNEQDVVKPRLHPLLQMQRNAGNQAVQHMLHRGAVPTAAANAKAGGDAPVPIKPLTEADRAIDLQADRFKGEKRLQDAFDDNPPLAFGATGPAVEILQQALLDLGFSLPKSTKKSGKPDGIYGQETAQIIKGFQWRQGIVKDGITGRQTLGELDGLFTGMTAPGTGASGPEVPGDAVTVSEVNVTPKEFGTCGGFSWGVDWDTNARNGYIVQEITREFVVEECGAPKPDVSFTPLYWEAWRVQTDGGIHGASGPDDDWKNPSADITKPLEGFPGTKGRWRITGKVYFVNQLDPKAGFKVQNVLDAGTLWSTTTRPGNLGTVLLNRDEGRTWKCCDGKESKDDAEKEE